MSITGPGSITAANIQAVNNMGKQLDTLTAELGSGQAAQTYSGLGSQAGLALSLNRQLAAITAYGNTATTVGTTLTVAQSVLSQLDGSRNSVIQAVGQQGTFALNGNGQTYDPGRRGVATRRDPVAAQYPGRQQLHFLGQRHDDTVGREQR